MEEITSVNNNLVKETTKLLQKKYRDESNKFILEGFKSIEEAFIAGLNIEHIFVNLKSANKYEFCKSKVILTSEAVLKKISAAETAPEAVAVAKQIHYSFNNLKNSNKLILLEDIKDLGNLGTIIRTASAFGIDGIILYGDCADIYNPKCVRAAVGNLWKLPIVYSKNFMDLKDNFKDFHKIATLPTAKVLLKDFKINDKTIVMFGSEANGLSDELINFATESIKIEMKDNVESLNLAVSCAIIMYKMI